MMGDEHLMRAVSGGDHKALKEIFGRHAPWVASRLRRSMPAHAVEDVLQETFIAVWRGAGRYKNEGEVGAWIWGIARNQAAMWARKHGRTEVDLEPAGSEDPAVVAANNADLGRALDSLGPEGADQRELARLILVEDRSVADTARLLGIPEGTVKSRMYKVRRLLRASLLQGEYR